MTICQLSCSYGKSNDIFWACTALYPSRICFPGPILSFWGLSMAAQQDTAIEETCIKLIGTYMCSKQTKIKKHFP